jgi:hypothetical protein
MTAHLVVLHPMALTLYAVAFYAMVFPQKHQLHP